MQNRYHEQIAARQRILFVEDLEADVELSVRELRRAGVECVAQRVETEQAFREQLVEFAPDLIVSDFSVPGFQGMDALMIARDLRPDLPFIFVSGTIGEETAIESLRLGATDYVLKSNLKRLAPAVLRADRERRESASRAEMAQALKNSEELFRQLAESIHEVFWVTDPTKNRMLYISPAYEAIWGRSCSQLYASPKDWSDALHPDDRERVLAAARTKQVAGTYAEEYRIARPDGSVRWISDRAFPIADKDGNVFRVVGIADDITDRKRSEEKLRESETKFRQLIEQASDGIFVSDRYGNFVLVNSRGCELLGYAEEELIGMNGRETYVDGDREHHAERMEAVRRGEDLRFERMVRRKDGSVFPAEVSVKMLDSGQVQVIFHDITTRRAHEHKITRLSRYHAVLSGINAAIVRIRDRKEMFREACRLAVEDGGFRMAWIGLVDAKAQKIDPVAWYGVENGFFTGTALLGMTGPSGEESGMLARAVRTRTPVALNEITRQNVILYDEHVDRGYRSVVVLPLVSHGESVGLLGLYSAETGIYDDEEMKLLNNLSADISFSIEYLGKTEELKFLAYHDALTGLPNRARYLERLEAALQTARQRKSRVAVVFGDVKRFRFINDTFGRRAGDALLGELAGRLRRVWPQPDSVARVSSDCFAAFLTEFDDLKQVSLLVDESVASTLGTPFTIDGKEIQVALTGGVAIFPDDGEDNEILMRNAEAAVKMAKLSGERFLFYQRDMTARTAETLLMENRMRKALENDQFVLHYQPKVDTATRKLIGLEALIRWNDPEGGLVPPSKFIPVLEETGLILQVGTWAIRRALEDMRAWKEAGFRAPRIAVNVSALQLQQKNFVDLVRKSLRAYGSGLCQLDIEITESLLMQNIEGNTAKLAALRDMGIMISIDDFGTGHSSLRYLAKLPVNALKIDRSFISTMSSNPDSATIVSTIISLAHSLSMKVIAEGVETEEQWKFLKLLKCDEIQGFLISQALPAEGVCAILGRMQADPDA